MKSDTKGIIKIGIGIFILYLCIHYWSAVAGFVGGVIGAAAPLIIGCFIAYVINILMRFYEGHYFPKSAKSPVQKSRRVVCMVLALVTLVAVVSLVLVLVVPQLLSCVQLLFAELPGALEATVDWLAKLKFIPKDVLSALNQIDWQSKISQIIEVVGSGIGDVVGVIVNAVTSVFSGIITAFISIIFAVYILMGKDKLGRQCKSVLKRYLKPNWYSKLRYTLNIFDDCFHRYIVGQCTEAVILGVLCVLGMWVLRLPYATMIGALIAFTALIPVAGAYIGGALGAFMILTVSPVKAIIFVVFLVILQQLEGNIIYPRVVGSSMGLPGIWVLAAVTVGGGVMGIPGMLLGVPIAAAVYRMVKNDVLKKEENKSFETEPQESLE